MIEFKNKSRTEAILENMLGATNTLKPPQSRIEALLMELLELIEDISHGSGTVFRFLGEKEYVDELPETGNEQGDVWFVKEKMAGFIWIVREDYPDGYWEELGEVIDTASLENVFFPVQYNVTPYSDILGAIQSNKVPVLIFYPGYGELKTRYAYFGYYDFTGVYFYEFSPDHGIIEYLIKTKQGWQSPRTINLVNSVDGRTGVVQLDDTYLGINNTAAFENLLGRVNAVAIPIVVWSGNTVMIPNNISIDPEGLSNLLLSSRKFVFGTAVLTMDGEDVYPSPDGRVFELDSLDQSTGQIDLHCVKAGILYRITMNYNGTRYEGTITETYPAQSPFMTATLTIAVSDWNNGSCTKIVTGMTEDSLVFVKYSDTETEYTEAQGANSMTFTAATTPSEAVTVGVAWLKEVANS